MAITPGYGARKRFIAIRVNQTEEFLLREMAKANAITVSAMARECIVRQAVMPLFGRVGVDHETKEA
jgi:hypothetical protein